MSNLNCPNCGAVIDSKYNKCQYCGTSYFDLSSINLDNYTPIYLKLRIHDRVITQKVIPFLETIEYALNYDTIMNPLGYPIRIANNTEVTTKIEFRSIGDIIEEDA